MSHASTDYFTAVQRHRDDLGQSVAPTADERDIVDDYATQEFGSEACAAHIAKERT